MLFAKKMFLIKNSSTELEDPPFIFTEHILQAIFWDALCQPIWLHRMTLSTRCQMIKCGTLPSRQVRPHIRSLFNQRPQSRLLRKSNHCHHHHHHLIVIIIIVSILSSSLWFVFLGVRMVYWSNGYSIMLIATTERNRRRSLWERHQFGFHFYWSL